ncbi:MAG: hypothetical protein ABW101_16390 [Candidatus Thiodiazotropha sp.]
MKRMLWIVLTPTLAFAQPPQPNPSSAPQADFIGLKTKLADGLQSSIGVMQQTSSCLSAVQEQGGFEGCYQAMPASMRQELQSLVFNTQPLTYTVDSRQRSIDIMTTWIQQSRSLIACFQQASDMDNVQGCFDTATAVAGNGSGVSTPPPQPQGGMGRTQLSEDW